MYPVSKPGGRQHRPDKRDGDVGVGCGTRAERGLGIAVTKAGMIADDLVSLQRSAIATDVEIAKTFRGTAHAPRGSKRKAQQLATLAVRRMKAGRLGPAIGHLREAVALDPANAGLLHELGLACFFSGQDNSAVAALEKATRLQPDLASAHYNLARALDRLGRARDAISAYREAIRLQPDLTDALLRLAELQLTSGNGSEAEACFRAVSTGAPDTDFGRINAARAALLAGAYRDAEALLREVISRAPGNGEAHATLGKVLANTGRLDAAADSYERAAMSDPNLAIAWYGCATSRKFTEADRPVIRRMQASLNNPILPPDHRMALHFALGKVYDDVGDYALAMQQFDAANGIDCASRRLDRGGLAQRVDQTIDSFPAGFLDRRPDFAVQSELPILIIGLPRSGTTLVEQILSSHPAVAAGGELTYWHDLRRGALSENEPADTARRIATDYLALLRGISADALRVTDKLPFNYDYLGLIRQVLPRAFIVHCRRHPIDTCLSIYTTHFRSRLADRGDLVFLYRQYERLMAHWRSVLTTERFFEIEYEALVREPEPVIRRLIGFCDLDWHEACLAPQHNRHPVMTASLWQARQPIYGSSAERWRRYEPWLGELRELLPSIGTFEAPRSDGLLPTGTVAGK
jgi:tetratricopeptide (TPR) repeat protein